LSGQFFTAVIIWSIFSTCKQQHLRVINTPTRLKTPSIFIYEPTDKISRICFGRKPTFGNWPSHIHHQANGSAHVDEGIESLLNKYNSQATNSQEDSLIEAPTPNMFFSSLGPTTSIVAIAYVPTIRLS
jgi:hypothetical protein